MLIPSKRIQRFCCLVRSEYRHVDLSMTTQTQQETRSEQFKIDGDPLAPWLAAVVAIAALVTDCTIVVERVDPAK
jgi:hypothetical protein